MFVDIRLSLYATTGGSIIPANAVELTKMTTQPDRLQQLESQLQRVNEEFEREMRARGFDPAQLENAALPSVLSRLYMERQSLIDEVEELKGENEQ